MLIENIFSNSTSLEETESDVTSTFSDHLPQFFIYSSNKAKYSETRLEKI